MPLSRKQSANGDLAMKLKHYILPGLLSLTLAACGGGGSSSGDDADNNAGNNDSDREVVDQIEGPSRVSFSQVAYDVKENDGSVEITVNRLGDPSEAISVSYSTVADSTIAGSDFVESVGILSWAANDTAPKKFTIQILSDNDEEDSETVNLLLSDPSLNTMIGNTGSAVLTIEDTTELSCIDLAPTDITTDTTLSEACYTVSSTIEVSNSATLTIKPGATLEFASGTALEIEKDGLLIANGTEQSPITFTSKLKSPGLWNGIKIDSVAPSQLNHTIVEYGGGSSFNTSNVAVSFGGQASINNSLIRHSASYGVSYSGSSSRLHSFSNNKVTLNQKAPIFIPFYEVFKLTPDNSFIGNQDIDGTNRDYIAVDSGSGFPIEINQIWHALDVPYHMLGTTHKLQAKMEIKPGATLVFPANAQMQIQAAGTLQAIGTEDKPIIFTGLEKTPGFWKGIQFFSSGNDNILDHTIVEYGGGGGNTLANVGAFSSGNRLTIKNSILRFSMEYGFEFYRNIDLTMENVTSENNEVSGSITFNDVPLLDKNSKYSGNTSDQIHVEGDSFAEFVREGTIQKLDVPYHFVTSSRYDVKNTLAIEPGTEIQFAADAQLAVNRTAILIADGEPDQPIVFTGAQKVKGYWTGIHFNFTDSNSIIDNAIIEFGGDDNTNSPGLVGFFGGAGGSVTNSVFRSSLSNGLHLEDDTVGTFSGNAFEDIDGDDIHVSD